MDFVLSNKDQFRWRKTDGRFVEIAEEMLMHVGEWGGEKWEERGGPKVKRLIAM